MSHLRSLVVLLLFISLSIFATATCAVPTAAGVKICTPGSGQTVNYPAEITASALGNSPITKMAVYVDGEKIYFDSGNQLDVVDGSVKAGTHRLTIRAWDSAGQSYSSTRNFTVVGGAIATCTRSTPGVKFCSPASGSLQPVNDITVVAGALGSDSKITRLKIYWRGYTIADTTSSSVTVEAGSGTPGTETMTAKAWDEAGHTYSTSTTFKTYYSGICSPKGCDPGVSINSPTDNSTVGTTFQLSADVHDNPAPITGMKAYLDGTLVASSGGSTLNDQIRAAAGSHRLTVQAWDSKGSLYRTVFQITVHQ